MQKTIIDCHCHSDNSFDADFPVRAMAEHAAAQGVQILCITDHCDFHVPGYDMSIQQAIAEGFTIPEQTVAIPRSVQQVRACADELPQLQLLAGVELGQAVQDEARAKEILSLCDYDFVLGSLHNLAREEDFYYMHYTPENVPAILARYFDELLLTAKQNLFDSLAHITYPLRYIIGDKGIAVDLAPYASVIDEIFKTVIKNGKAIEVNTSGLRQKIGVTFPDRELLCRYRMLGGELVTVGSDAHKPEDIAKGMTEAYSMLKACGFDRITYYKARKPQYIQL